MAAKTSNQEIKKLSKSELVSQYSPLVRSIAAKIKKRLPQSIEFEELVAYGTLGLLEAADRFDSKQETAFVTFAYYRIRGAIYDGLRNMGWLGRGEYARYKYEAGASEYLAAVEQDLAPELAGMSPETAANRLNTIVNNLATIFITSMDGLENLQIADNSEKAQDEQLISGETTTLLKKAITALNEQERQVIEMYYYQDKSLQEIGESLGLSKSWTSRLHARIIEKLYRILERTML